MCIRLRIVLVAMISIACGLGRVYSSEVDFDRDIAPVLKNHCVKCHGSTKQQGGLRFDVANAAFARGDSGEQAIVPGDAAASTLLQRVVSEDEFIAMPPEGERLSADEIELLKRWINEGAAWSEQQPAAELLSSGLVVTEEDRQHWAFRPLQQPSVPRVASPERLQTPIDAFIQSELEAHAIAWRDPASPRTLIRRIKMDLVGLPPTIEEVEDFERAYASDSRAVARLVEALLSSVHYGERWGRHWLDVARYADSHGQEGDQDRPHAYRYRDFVIEALNDDMPFDQFVEWQIAGNEIAPSDPRAVAATGFLAAGPSTLLKEEPSEKEKAFGRFIERMRNRYNELDDIIATVGTGMLGLTVGCARCHDHKFDAIPTRDYYQLLAAFQSGERGDVYLAPAGEIATYSKKHTQWKKELGVATGRLKQWLDKLAKEGSISGKATEKELERLMTPEQHAEWNRLKASVREIERSEPAAPPQAFVYSDRTREPAPAWLFPRGDFLNQSQPVELGFLTVLTRSTTAKDYWDAARASHGSEDSTYQRAALAAWLTDVENGAGALLARVIVNRIWQHHFGQGLVRTVDDFGVQGEMPTHPELLEWLACEFVNGGWQIKRIHKLIMTSAVYLQDTDFDEECARIDPQNRLLWRREPRRLEAEALRDAMLFAAGTLNQRPFGPGFKPTIPKDAMVARNLQSPYNADPDDSPEVHRRSVYMFHKRVIPYPLMELFDRPVPTLSCGRRQETLVATQALALLNDPFVRRQAEEFARRLIRESSNTRDQVRLAFECSLSRVPEDNELSAASDFITQRQLHRMQRDSRNDESEANLAALADFCQVLFGLNEFSYVD